MLVSLFVSKAAAKTGNRIECIPKPTLDRLVAYDWPGNVRELENVIERAVILSQNGRLSIDESLGAVPTAEPFPQGSSKQDLDAVERRRIEHALEECGWKIKGEGNAASRLNLEPSTLRSRMKALGIERPSGSRARSAAVRSHS